MKSSISEKNSKGIKQGWLSRFVTLYIFMALTLSVISFVVVTRRAMADAQGDDLERFIYETSRVITDNWCDGFIDNIVFTVGDPIMYVDGTPVEIDPGTSTSPVMIDSAKFLPVCALIEVVGGSLYDIGEAPITINNTYMLPADAIAEGLYFELDWNPATQEITLTRDFQTRRLIVGAAAEADFAGLGATDIIDGPGNITVLQFATISETQSAYDWLNNVMYVDWVEPDLILPPVDAIPSYYGIDMFSASHRSWGVERSGLDQFAEHVIYRGNDRPIVVAVLDTGVESGHPFLQGRVKPGWCTVTNNNATYDVMGHGTHVTGTVIDATPGLTVYILPVRVYTRNGGTTLTIANGIRWAASRAEVINISMGGRDYCQTINASMQYATDRNVTVVAAAGNSAADAMNYSPGNNAHTITVAASDIDNNPSMFTNWGTIVTLSAPGVGINSAFVNGGFLTMNGTSTSAPHVSAAVAMYIMNNPGISPASIRAAMGRYVNTPTGWNSSRYGAGILDMTKAIGTSNHNPEIILGNVTGSGTVSAADVARLRAYLAGYSVEIIREAADVNGDGRITAADVALIRAYLAGYNVAFVERE